MQLNHSAAIVLIELSAKLSCQKFWAHLILLSYWNLILKEILEVFLPRVENENKNNFIQENFDNSGFEM